SAYGFSLPAPVGAGENLQEVAIRILEIESPAAIVVIDFSSLCFRGIGPIGKPSLSNACKNFVELSLANEKSVVLLLYFPSGIHEINVGSIVSGDHLERSPFFWCRQPQNVGQKLRRCTAIARPNNGVIELDGHVNLSRMVTSKMPWFLRNSLVPFW